MSNSNILKIGSLLNKFPNKSSKIELSQELKDKLVSVVSAYGKSNSDEDRDIIKDKTGKGNDFQILNANYKLNSSFGKYEEDFTSWRIYPNIKVTDNVITTNGNFNSTWFIYKHSNENEINEMNIKVSGIPEGGIIRYFYIPDETATIPVSYNISEDGVYHLPKSKLSSNRVSVGFTVSSSYDWNNIRIEQIPLFKGAFTTDGIDDLIVSTKTIEEMGITDEVTVISMIHQIDNNKNNFITTNNFRTTNRVVGRNIVSNIEKTGIYGWYKENIQKEDINIINNILGDKNDYIAHSSSSTNTTPINSSKFYVTGYVVDENNYNELSSVAWYWTVIAKAVLTTDEINQVIAYYNLDRPGEIVKPDILYDVKRQGITNENHAEFNDELIDFSGNNYNLKLYNMLWDKQSGIGNYPISFKDYTYVPSRATVQVNKNSFTITSNSNTGNFLEVNTKNKTLPIYKVKVEGTNTITNGVLSYRFNNTEGVISRMSIPEDGEYEIPESPSTVNSVYSGWCINGGTNDNLNIKITLLPTDDITNAVVLDGISSFGKAINVPIYKDYTICALRKWLFNTSKNAGGIFSKSEIANSGAFIFEQTFNINPSVTSTWNFGVINQYMNNDKLNEKSITAQTKFTYNYNGQDFKIGNGLDYSNLWFGIIRDRESRHSNIALWNAMIFPYSLSEFLLERQLKKYKLGTLYPNQVEFRPIVNSNLEYKSIQYINKADGTDMVVGQYYPSDTSIQILITPTQPNKVNKITINGKEPVFINSDNGVYKYEWNFDGKSPQQIKLKLGIDENLVLFNPIINSNVEYKKEEYFIINNSIWTKINSLDYISIGQKIAIKIYLNGIVDKLIAATSLDLENISSISKASKENSYYFLANVTSKSPQNIDIVIDEYIRYEDIKQPYPVIFRFFNKDTNKEYTWGDIIKVGSIINIKSLIFSLGKFYSVSGYSVNNKGNYSWMQISSMDIEVIKTLSFSSNSTWKFGQGPLFIYDPSLINNIGLKNLGYLPDITGQNNNLNLYNFEYIPNSGKGQYLIDFNNWRLVRSTLDKQVVKFNRDEFVGSVFFCGFLGTNKVDIPSFTVNIDFSSNKEGACPHYYFWDKNGNRNSIDLIKGLNILPANYASKSDDSMGSGFHDTLCDTVTIEQVAFDEEALYFDGIDNYGNIPSITNVKSILMQVKWSYLGKILYDQRKNYNSEFAILSDDTNLNGDKIYAYQARNNGNTYIQGFLNKNLYASVLKDLLHNIIITNDLTEIGQNPYIGCTIETTYFSKMAMYKVMGFDKVISEDEIKLLNENWLGLGNNFIYLNPNIQIDTTLAIKDIKIFQNNAEVNKGYLFTGAQNGVEFELRVSLAEGKYGLDEITVDGETISSSSEIDGYKVFKFTLFDTNEQNVTIHTYEYIMYEDIVQPFPTVFRLLDTTNNYEYTYGDKLKVGSKVKFASFSNLLPELYRPNGTGQYNGVTCVSGTVITVEKQMVFSWSASFTYLKTNAPKCIFSPNRLRIPNESYRYLGYIPDISGNGNNGIINNSAYAGMSGVNGYPYDYNNSSFWCDSVLAKVVSGELIEYFAVKNSTGFSNITSGVYKGEIKVTGVTKAISENKISRLRIYSNSTTDNELIDITQDGNYNIDIKGVGDANRVFFYAIPNNPNESIVVRLTEPIYIEQVGEYEGSFCFDGVDDFVTIPTLSSGGKQVLMKVNWNKAGILYDQRRTGNNFAIYTAENIPAYNARNDDGSTYIDGILNNNIIASDLINITHNLIVVNNNVNDSNTVSPRIGFSVYDNLYSKFALYDFMFFDDISSDEEIKELNDIIGIEDNIIEWNPTITSNISSAYSFVPNIRKSDGTIVGLKIGNIYLASITGNLVLDIVPPNKNLDEVSNVVIDGKSYTPIKYPDYYRVEIPLVFPNEINVTIDEYITYETIEQPYPIFLNYIDKETNKAYTWGDKVKVGSLLKISDYKNLFENGEISLGGSNGYSINGSSELVALGTLLTSEILVNKINTGVKSSVIWNLDTPKPLFAYDPSIINNIGLKNLGYLPDITGQGRHLLLDGFAYEGMSGVNGYPVVLGVNKTWTNIVTSNGIIWNYKLTSTSISIYKSDPSGSFLIRTWVISNGVINSVTIPEFKIKISNLKDGEIVQYHYVSNDNNSVVSFVSLKTNGIHTLPASVPIVTEDVSTNKSIGFTFKLNNNANVDGLTIEVLSNYEGSLYFDGVNDYGTVQNLTYGGKCLISKLNYNLKSSIIYDQRSTLDNTPDTNTFALVINTTNDNAYSTRLTGDVYIDNVLNNYISNINLNNNIHVVTATCSIVDSSNSEVPIFGRSKTESNHAQFAMYKTILFPEIPSDADRTTINNWVGIEAKVELPSYYWDAYGKINLDADRGYIKDQVSLQLNNDNTNDNSLENFNFGYEGMSGYNGYPVVLGANKTWETSNAVDYIYDINSTIVHITNVKHAANGLLYSYVKRDGALANIKEIPAFRVTVKGLEGNSKFVYKYLATENATKESIVYLGNGTHKLPKSFVPTDALLDLTTNSWIGFAITPMIEGELVFDCDITIEILPEYENGLAYDGVSDFTDNKNIPIFTDFTAIIKRVDLDAKNDNSTVMFKGNKIYESSIGNGFTLDYCYNSKNYVYSYGKLNQIERDDSKIIYLTPESYNGNPIIKGENGDNLGLVLGKYWKGIIYKTILYSKTISLLEINFLKNLMEKNEIINLNNPIFIQK